MSKRIYVDDDTYAALTALKLEEESYDDVVCRLLETRKAAVSAGAGLWSDSDAAAAARDAREWEST